MLEYVYKGNPKMTRVLEDVSVRRYLLRFVAWKMDGKER